MQAEEFFNVLTSAKLLQTTEALLPAHRERLYPPTVTLSMFMRQVLQADGSCQQAVNGWAAQRAAIGLSTSSVRTGAYCRARQRLPLQMVQMLMRQTGHQLSAEASALWHGRSVKLIDGTGISMPDTPENQASYPQPGSQAAGVGFPQAQVVAIICLASGAVLDAAMGPCSGKGNSELGLLRRLGAAFKPGDVVLADALYCNYFEIATLMAGGVDVLMEQHGARITDFRRGQRLGVRDHLVSWPKPRRPPWMSLQQYAALPDTLTLREVRVCHKVLVTTMSNHRALSRHELQALYARRWNIELDLRNLKTTLGMQVLSCHTPQMNEKELWVYLLAYNMIRHLMAQAAHDAGVNPRQISFKHTVQMCTEWTSRGVRMPADRKHLLALIAQCRVGNRAGRIEPRKRKRRPKPYPWLTEPRHQARVRVRRYGHE